MSSLQELYHELILDHGRNPRHFGATLKANRVAEGFNPLCGDRLILLLRLDPTAKRIEAVQFHGSGCAISMASASMMAEKLEGKTVEAANELFKLFCQQVTQKSDEPLAHTDALGKLGVLAGVRAFPSRVKCATLAWHTLQNALTESSAVIAKTE